MMERAIVFHADILGFKNIIRQAELEEDDSTLSTLKGTLSQGIGTVNQFQAMKLHSPIRYKLFSDNLYASFPYNEGNIQSFSDALICCLAFVRSYTAVMLDNEIFIRGGIAIGKDYSDDSVIFSIALVKAYELEAKAVFPRVLILDDIVTILKNGIETPGPASLRMINNSILKDEEGLYFVTPTGLSEEFEVEAGGLRGSDLNKAFIRRHLKTTQKIIDSLDPASEETEKIIRKYNWLRRVLTWLYMDRDNEKSHINTFSSLRLI